MSENLAFEFWEKFRDNPSLYCPTEEEMIESTKDSRFAGACMKMYRDGKCTLEQAAFAALVLVCLDTVKNTLYPRKQITRDSNPPLGSPEAFNRAFPPEQISDTQELIRLRMEMMGDDLNLSTRRELRKFVEPFSKQVGVHQSAKDNAQRQPRCIFCRLRALWRRLFSARSRKA